MRLREGGRTASQLPAAQRSTARVAPEDVALANGADNVADDGARVVLHDLSTNLARRAAHTIRCSPRIIAQLWRGGQNTLRTWVTPPREPVLPSTFTTLACVPDYGGGASGPCECQVEFHHASALRRRGERLCRTWRAPPVSLRSSTSASSSTASFFGGCGKRRELEHARRVDTEQDWPARRARGRAGRGAVSPRRGTRHGCARRPAVRSCVLPYGFRVQLVRQPGFHRELHRLAAHRVRQARVTCPHQWCEGGGAPAPLEVFAPDRSVISKMFEAGVQAILVGERVTQQQRHSVSNCGT
jgi:hypothetical protein